MLTPFTHHALKSMTMKKLLALHLSKAESRKCYNEIRITFNSTKKEGGIMKNVFDTYTGIIKVGARSGQRVNLFVAGLPIGTWKRAVMSS